MTLAALGGAVASLGLIFVAAVFVILFALEHVMNPAHPRFHEWAKQLAVWLAITTLLPFSAYFATEAFSRMPDPADFYRRQSRLNEELMSAKTDAEKDRLRAQIDTLTADHDRQERAFATRSPKSSSSATCSAAPDRHANKAKSEVRSGACAMPGPATTVMRVGFWNRF